MGGEEVLHARAEGDAVDARVASAGLDQGQPGPVRAPAGLLGCSAPLPLGGRGLLRPAAGLGLEQATELARRRDHEVLAVQVLPVASVPRHAVAARPVAPLEEAGQPALGDRRAELRAGQAHGDQLVGAVQREPDVAGPGDPQDRRGLRRGQQPVERGPPPQLVPRGQPRRGRELAPRPGDERLHRRLLLGLRRRGRRLVVGRRSGLQHGHEPGVAAGARRAAVGLVARVGRILDGQLATRSRRRALVGRWFPRQRQRGRRDDWRSSRALPRRTQLRGAGSAPPSQLLRIHQEPVALVAPMGRALGDPAPDRLAADPERRRGGLELHLGHGRSLPPPVPRPARSSVVPRWGSLLQVAEDQGPALRNLGHLGSSSLIAQSTEPCRPLHLGAGTITVPQGEEES